MLDVLKNAFSSLDRDENGHLDQAELSVLALTGEGSIEAYDKDANGQVSLEEYVKQSLTEQGY